MECSVCYECFDTKLRRPKTLPCGHSFCSACLVDPKFGRICPVDRKRFQGPVTKLPDNFALLGLLADQPGRVAYYCLDCDRQSSDACVVERKHRIATMSQLRAEEGDRQLRQLQRGAAAARDVVRLLEQETLELDHRLQSWRMKLEKVEDDEVKLRAALEAASPGLMKSFEAVAKQVGPLDESARLLAVGGSATLVLSEGDTYWQAIVELPAAEAEAPGEQAGEAGKAGDPPAPKRGRLAGEGHPKAARLVRHALLQLLRDDQLKKVGPECLMQPQWGLELLPQLRDMTAKFSKPEQLDVLAAMPALRSLRLKGPLPEAAAGPVHIPDLESLHLDFMQTQYDLSQLRVPNLRTLSISAWSQVLQLRSSPQLRCRRLELCLVGKARLSFSPEPSPLVACLEELVLKVDTSDLAYDLETRKWVPRYALDLRLLASDLLRAGAGALRGVHFDRDAWAYRSEHSGIDCATQLLTFKSTLNAKNEPWSSAVVLSCSVCSPHRRAIS